MDETKKQRRKTQLVGAISLTISLVFGCPLLGKEHQKNVEHPLGSIKAGSRTEEQARLAELENRLFFQTFSQDNNLKRLTRIEKQVFGAALDGQFSERLSKVTAAATPPLSSDHLSNGADKSTSATTSTTKNQVPFNTTVQSTKGGYEHEEERKKLLILQAKDQEISKLLADGVALWRIKRGKEAIEKFRQVIRLDPNNAEAHFSMGIIYESLGNLKEAETGYRKAFTEDPDNKEYRDALAVIQKKLMVTPKIDNKQEELRTLAKDASAAYNRGEYLSAVDLYKQLDERAPNQALVKYNLGTLHLLLNNPVIALSYYKEAIRLKPNELRYVEAYKKLEANVRKDDEERARAEAAWQGQETMPPSWPTLETNDDQRKQTRRASDRDFTLRVNKRSPSQDNVILNYGVTLKSHRDGVRIVAIDAGSRGAKAGLRTGDIIRAVDGTVVKSPQEVNNILSGKAPQAPVQIMIQREQQMGELSL